MIKGKVILIGLLLLSNHLFSQKTFTYNGNTINLDDIPLGRSLDKPVNGSKSIGEGKSLSNLKVFASDNKKFVVVAESYDNVNNKINASSEGSIKVYSSDGKLLWEKKKDSYAVYDCKVDPNGAFIHVNWSFQGEESNTKLVSYDKNGNELNVVEEVQYYYSGESKDKLYYVKWYNTNKPEDKYKLYYKNFITGKQWEKLFPSTQKVFVMAVSSDGENSVVCSDKICLIDNLGNIIWEKNQFTSPGYISISEGNNKILWVPKTGLMYLFDKSGNEIWEKGKIAINNNIFSIDGACFVSNNNKIIVASSINQNENTIVFIDINGKILDKISFKEIMFGVEKNIIWGQISVTQSDNKYTIYYNGYKTYEYIANWQ